MVRNITRDDYQTCADIYNFYAVNSTATFDLEPYSYAEYEAKINNILKKYPYLVYTDEKGVILGFAYLSPYIDRRAADCSAELAVYVSKDHPHKGIGSNLVREIESIAPKYHITKIVSVITDTNDASIAMHKKLGYVCEGYIHDVAIKDSMRLGVVIYTKEVR